MKDPMNRLTMLAIAIVGIIWFPLTGGFITIVDLWEGYSMEWIDGILSWLLAQHEVTAAGWQAVATAVSSVIGTLFTAYRAWVRVDTYVRHRLAAWREAAEYRRMEAEDRQFETFLARVQTRGMVAKVETGPPLPDLKAPLGLPPGQPETAAPLQPELRVRCKHCGTEGTATSLSGHLAPNGRTCFCRQFFPIAASLEQPK